MFNYRLPRIGVTASLRNGTAACKTTDATRPASTGRFWFYASTGWVPRAAMGTWAFGHLGIWGELIVLHLHVHVLAVALPQ
jgi:hypothetical protein